MRGLRIDTESANGRTVVRLAGELDSHSGDRLRAELGGLLGGASQGSRVELDLHRLGFMDSSGLSVLIGAHKQALARGAELVLVGVPPGVHRMLRITGLLPVLRIEGSAGSAEQEKGEQHQRNR
ncbi:anti-sigma F factor antagonist [Amycolatopsis antarctica]|uniref:Anti-sigma factor antagonist n=1 Tax=Amycolatopsis antarctica TaxID=1854586 RepID=A0A263CVH0_9PSEU|nr:STAS domain-containing protein [Amycolatopsis antarctica]OZM70114.1 anti-sigma F factor antagonist [Amycolatopsis antarctica]